MLNLKCFRCILRIGNLCNDILTQYKNDYVMKYKLNIT